MFQELCAQLNYPAWSKDNPRYRRLFALDALLNNTIYDCLLYEFYCGKGDGGKEPNLNQRRPSLRFNLPRYVSKQIARKLFGGRHAPRFTHQDEQVVEAATAIVNEGFLMMRMVKAALWGSVGAVAITFRITEGGEGKPRIVFDVWRARYCWPTFDPLGELANLRLAYTTKGATLMALGINTDDRGKKIEEGKEYWFVRDYKGGLELTYQPRDVSDDEAKEMFTRTDLKEFPADAAGKKQWQFTVPDDVVPAHWFVNLAGQDEPPDGPPTWEDAIDVTIELAYVLSQTGRGVRYNQEPQVVTIGNLKGGTEPMTSEPSVDRGGGHVLQLEAEESDQSGTKRGRGDAKLLEMTGTATKAALEYAEFLWRRGMEIIAASRKDPERMRMPQSGKALDALDEDFWDLIGEEGDAYGTHGMLPLVRKAMRVAAKMEHPLVKGVNLNALDSLGLKWPTTYQPNAQELLNIVQALNEAMTPKEVPTGQTRSIPSANGGAPTVEPITQMQKPLLTWEEARLIFDAQVDMPLKTATAAMAQQPRDDTGTGDAPAPSDAAPEPDDGDGAAADGSP
jgi:hypothetical protein